MWSCNNPEKFWVNVGGNKWSMKAELNVGGDDELDNTVRQTSSLSLAHGCNVSLLSTLTYAVCMGNTLFAVKININSYKRKTVQLANDSISLASLICLC